ncbi:cobalamin synthesis CobW domain protein [Kribbella flavida DSM 17836]|uniref:Cobalamin synthesis CobW domain protein n=1 Tax=Kribbella flavida (strain DSM 17836 / JCM 10339 / NBRC 14399) TaxID=479435 RepID=D2Q174_KRIFD|nr:GTP-binding protein [Kribbella flavida]ADB35775.1 cobalamin synthesis CobW domain protein [Kribbella flavida DSM 17836]
MLPVTLVTGVGDTTRGAAAADLLVPGTVLVEYDVSELAGGSVVRTARTTAGLIDREVIRMGHPCVSCAMRGSLVELLRGIAAVEQYQAAVVNVPGAGDSQALAEEVARDAAEELQVSVVLAVVDPGSFVVDVTGEDLLRDRGIPTAAEDGRALAEAVVRQLEYADAILVASGQSVSASQSDTAGALARAINPQARMVARASELAGVRLHDPDAAEARVEPGAVSAPLMEETGPVRTLVWSSDRPFHPERLYDALEDLVENTARGKGTVWLATQPHARLGWDSFGTNITIGVLGRWLADLPAERWSEVSSSHQARSLFEWHPEHGDRGSYLSITGIGLDVWELRRRLDGCALRADEEASRLTDPFAPYLEGSTAA